MSQPAGPPPYEPVPDSVLPAGELPPLRFRDLPPPVPLWRMIGPGIILAGLALGSGEFVLWPYITFRTGFLFFSLCVLGVVTQYFINMEITRYTLATGESALTGFIRRSRHWAWAFLVLNIVPWMIPAWAKGAAMIVSWLIWGPQLDPETGVLVGTYYATPLAIGGMVLCGAILTAGPVLYETVEKVQLVLVSLIVLLVIGLAGWLLALRPDAAAAMAAETFTLGLPETLGVFRAENSIFQGDLTPIMMLGALAFAGAGGTTNLGQSNYIKDKGYGMGRFIGRITSPITGRQEPVTELGYFFPDTEENQARWRVWWRRAGWEHFLSFFCTCLICLVLLALISYVLFFSASGKRVAAADKYSEGMGFVWGEADQMSRVLGGPAGGVAFYVFLIMGVAILLTTEFGVLDAATRISTDIVKVAWLRENRTWSESRLYYLFLWGSIFLGTAILLLETVGINVGALHLFTLSSAMNGAVMFLYSGLLLYVNRFKLPPAVRMGAPRAIMLIWSVLFFGAFSVAAAWYAASQWFKWP